MRTLAERIEIRTEKSTIESFNSSLKDIISKIHELCAEKFVEQYKVQKFQLKESEDYSLFINLIDGIKAYSRKLENLSLDTDMQDLYEKGKLNTSLADVELTRKDAIRGS